MAESSSIEEKFEPQIIKRHANMNILKYSWDYFDSLSYTSFFSKNSGNKLNEKTDDSDELKKEFEPLNHNSDKITYDVELQLLFSLTTALNWNNKCKTKHLMNLMKI